MRRSKRLAVRPGRGALVDLTIQDSTNILLYVAYTKIGVLCAVIGTEEIPLLRSNSEGSGRSGRRLDAGCLSKTQDRRTEPHG